HSMLSPCPCTPTLGTRLARLMTRSAPTPAPIGVATFVILFPSCPRSRQDIPFSCPRAYGWLCQLGYIRCTQAECGCGATLYVKFTLIARRKQSAIGESIYGSVDRVTGAVSAMENKLYPSGNLQTTEWDLHCKPT